MSLAITCDKQRQPTQDKVTCKRDGNVLKWDSQPKCKFDWGDWSNWGPCDQTCGGGILQRRNRKCKGTDNTNDCVRDQGGQDHSTASCKTVDSCYAEKKYKCGSGKCIHPSRLCDGNDDCGDNEDENKGNCPGYIHSDQWITLRDHDSDHWLDCSNGHCRLGTCARWSMDDDDWSSCGGQTFRLYNIENDRSPPYEGGLVRSGDKIALYYGGTSWLGCDNGCNLKSCPGWEWQRNEDFSCLGEAFVIYSPERHRNCGSNTFGCRGDLIQKEDNVFILQHYSMLGTPLWLSHYGGDISVQTCPGTILDNNDPKYCDSESCKIFQQK